MRTKIGAMRIVATLGKEYQFISDSQAVAPIKDDIGKAAQSYDAFFVLMDGGAYVEVWGMVGIVPFKSKLVSRLV